MIFLSTISEAAIILIFIFCFIRQISYWTWLWQLKEYRIDRLRSHFQDIRLKNTFLALIGYSALRQAKIPKLTSKAVLILSFSFLIIAVVLFMISRSFPPDIAALNSPGGFWKNEVLEENIFLFGFLVVEFLGIPMIIFFFVGVLNYISRFFKKEIIAKATAKMAKFPKLKVIGITGSYGKSTTKEMLGDILSKKYKVLKTPENINTAIGISQLILDNLDETYEIFVVEMGAYKIGEIKEICDIVHPEMGIITAINEQHLALFGKIENTIKAKFELVDSLPKDGLAILNTGDVNIQAGIESRNLPACGLKAKIILYSVGSKADIFALDETCAYQGIKFKFISGDNMKDFSVNILGAHNISNALAAIIAASHFNMDLDDISQALQKVDYLDISLKRIAGPKGSTLINDTYNANPDGVLAALEYFKNYRGRKIVVMSSLIELGPYAVKAHQKIGKAISSIATIVFLLDNYYISDIKKGILENSDSDIELKYENNIKKILEYLKGELKSTDTVLFINRGAGKVLELLVH